MRADAWCQYTGREKKASYLPLQDAGLTASERAECLTRCKSAHPPLREAQKNFGKWICKSPEEKQLNTALPFLSSVRAQEDWRSQVRSQEQDRTG